VKNFIFLHQLCVLHLCVCGHNAKGYYNYCNTCDLWVFTFFEDSTHTLFKFKNNPFFTRLQPTFLLCRLGGVGTSLLLLLPYTDHAC
jgi:hypothetical protein